MPERDVHMGIAGIRSGRAAPSVGDAAAGAVVTAPQSASGSGSVGRVLAINVSAGGVPKLPVPEAEVGPLGLAGDGHHDVADHGGPMRAVSVLAIEAIRRVAADGNPIGPGTTGENVTTEGIEWGALPSGTRAAIGPEVVVELTDPAFPCRTIAHNFADGRFSRLSSKVHPLDTRVYASVVRVGTIRPGDEIRVLGSAGPRR